MNPEFDKDTIKYSFLKEYFEGEPSEEKKQKIISWFDHPELRFKLESCLKELWKETDPEKHAAPGGMDPILDRIHHRINLLNPPAGSRKKILQKDAGITFNIAIKYISRVAAILLLPIMIYAGWKVLRQDIFLRNQAEIVYNEIICPLGARSRFELPDGTTGWLNNGSSLKFPVKFTEEEYRKVELSGEAYFDVVHQRMRPFLILTGGLDVKVMGTKLNVHAYPDEDYQTFTLEKGSIELIQMLAGTEKSIYKLEPGQHVVYVKNADDKSIHESEDSQDKTIIIGEQTGHDFLQDQGTDTPGSIETRAGRINVQYRETSRYTGWKDGKLILRNDPMQIMLKRIERWYNVRFNVTDERINQFRYRATFEEENLDFVLKALSLTGPITFEKRAREQEEDGSFKAQVIDVKMKD